MTATQRLHDQGAAPEIDQYRFREVCGSFPTGTTVVTSLDGPTPIGRTVNSFTSLSLDPPLILICLHRQSLLLTGIVEHGAFGVNILAEDQRELSTRFTSGRSEQFTGLPYRRGYMGTPLLPESIAYLTCDLHAVLSGGDHQVVLGRVMELDVLRSRSSPLMFFRGSHLPSTDAGVR